MVDFKAAAIKVKPSRSDDVPDPVQQLEITNRVRAQFESIAPKRPVKPNRSEPDSVSSTSSSIVDIGNIPELHKLQSLRSQSQARFIGGGDYDAAGDEFVETEYYEKLVSIDKQHHTTGSGFIRLMNKEGEKVNDYGGVTDLTANAMGDRSGIRSNPATNDWVPDIDEHQVFVSAKPNRSEAS